MCALLVRVATSVGAVPREAERENRLKEIKRKTGLMAE
jgi:hypothetical protein